MRNHFLTLITSGAIVATMLTGCSAEDESEPKEQNTSSKAAALTGPVEDASRSPSGNVEPTTIADVIDAHAEMDLVTLGSHLPGGLDFDPFAGADLDCVDGDGSAGSIDMACASGGQASGTLRYEIAVEGTVAFVYHAFDDICVDAEGICISGEGAIEAGSDQSGAARTVVAGNLFISGAAGDHELRYGVSVIADAGGVREEVVLWHNGQSYVVSTQVSGAGVSYSVSGANGSWSCDVSGSGDALSGSCLNGADSFDF